MDFLTTVSVSRDADQAPDWLMFVLMAVIGILLGVFEAVGLRCLNMFMSWLYQWPRPGTYAHHNFQPSWIINLTLATILLMSRVEGAVSKDKTSMPASLLSSGCILATSKQFSYVSNSSQFSQETSVNINAEIHFLARVLSRVLDMGALVQEGDAMVIDSLPVALALGVPLKFEFEDAALDEKYRALIAALPTSAMTVFNVFVRHYDDTDVTLAACLSDEDRKSTRLNSSHSQQSRMPSSA